MYRKATDYCLFSVFNNIYDFYYFKLYYRVYIDIKKIILT